MFMQQIAEILPKDNPLESLNIPDSISSLVEFITFCQNELGRVLTKDELELCKVRWRKFYQKKYHNEKRKSQKRTTISFTKEEYKLLKEYARVHRTNSLNAFIKRTSLAYVEEKYVPRDSEKIKEINVQIRSIGRNINQVVQRLQRKIFKVKVTKLSEDQYALLEQSYTSLLDRVEALEKEVMGFTSKPPLNLEQALQELIELQPDKIELVIAFLEQSKK